MNILIRCLIKARVINRQNKWIGNDTHVVQLGDILDGGGRGTTFKSNPMEEFQIYDFLNNLDIEARNNGGRVHYLIGNHELMNLEGDFRYVHNTHLSHTGVNIRRQLFKPGGYMANMLACHAYGVLKINKWYFCHAGLLPIHVTNRNITVINNLVRDILRGNRTIEDLSYDEQQLIFSNNKFSFSIFISSNDEVVLK